MDKLNLIKESLNEIKEQINELIEKNGIEMYHGVFDTINELENDEEHWVDLINDLEEDYNDEEDEDSFISMILVDSIDRELMRRFGTQLGNNLIKLGYVYDGEGWNLKNKWNEGDLTCYGVIWDYWYNLDTDVRESVGDIFEEELEGII
jgi:hypothetical protein